MKPFKQLLEEWTEKNSDNYDWPEYKIFDAGAAASNELVLQLWEALEWLNDNAEHCTVGIDRISTDEITENFLKSIREKLEGTK